MNNLLHELQHISGLTNDGLYEKIKNELKLSAKNNTSASFIRFPNDEYVINKLQNEGLTVKFEDETIYKYDLDYRDNPNDWIAKDFYHQRIVNKFIVSWN